MKLFKDINFSDGSKYSFSKVFLSLILLIGLVFSVFVLGYDGFFGKAHFYSACANDSSRSCHNPYFNNSIYCGKDISLNDSLCTVEPIPSGVTLGTPPPWFVSNYYLLVFGFLIIGFIFNHFLFNKSFSFSKLVDGDISIVRDVRFDDEKSWKTYLFYLFIILGVVGFFVSTNIIFKALSTFISVYCVVVIIEKLIKKRVNKGNGDSPIGGSNG